VVATNIWSHAPALAKPLLAIGRLFMTSAQTGGDRIVYLAADPAVAGQTGGYYENNRRVEPSALGQDAELARKLWDVSAKLVHLDPATSPVGTR
jgi:hypothetical protein